jgi:hypothetical protein
VVTTVEEAEWAPEPETLVLENPHAVHQVPPKDCKVGVRCAVNARRIIGPSSFEEIIYNSRIAAPQIQI